MIKGDKLYLNPIPEEKCIITIDYLTLAIGENKNGEEIFALKKDSDVLNIPEHLEELLKNCSVKPIIHQMEIHPLFTQSDITQFCKQEEIQIMAYTPLARNDDRLRNSKNFMIR